MSDQLGETIRRERRRQGLTQAELAERANLGSATTISGIETGNHRASKVTAVAVMRALGIDEVKGIQVWRGVGELAQSTRRTVNAQADLQIARDCGATPPRDALWLEQYRKNNDALAEQLAHVERKALVARRWAMGWGAVAAGLAVALAVVVGVL